VHASLHMMQREGLANVYARHDRLCRATRAAAKAMGLKLLAPDSPSPAATGIYLPVGIDADAVLEYLRDKMNITLAEGQDQLKGKGAYRVHGGGFAGTILLFVPKKETTVLKASMEAVFGQNSFILIRLRQDGVYHWVL